MTMLLDLLGGLALLGGALLLCAIELTSGETLPRAVAWSLLASGLVVSLAARVRLFRRVRRGRFGPR